MSSELTNAEKQEILQNAITAYNTTYKYSGNKQLSQNSALQIADNSGVNIWELENEFPEINFVNLFGLPNEAYSVPDEQAQINYGGATDPLVNNNPEKIGETSSGQNIYEMGGAQYTYEDGNIKFVAGTTLTINNLGKITSINGEPYQGRTPSTKDKTVSVNDDGTFTDPTDPTISLNDDDQSLLDFLNGLLGGIPQASSTPALDENIAGVDTGELNDIQMIAMKVKVINPAMAQELWNMANLPIEQVLEQYTFRYNLSLAISGERRESNGIRLQKKQKFQQRFQSFYPHKSQGKKSKNYRIQKRDSTWY